MRLLDIPQESVLILLEKPAGFKYDFKRKEASGLCLFPRLHGVQVVGGSNPLTPTMILNRRILLNKSLKTFVQKILQTYP